MSSLKAFQVVPGVGPNMAQNLVDLGYKGIHELRGENPEAMYENLISLRGRHIDRCVLYVFRCAVYFAGNCAHEPELLKWWSWKDTR